MLPRGSLWRQLNAQIHGQDGIRYKHQPLDDLCHKQIP